MSTSLERELRRLKEAVEILTGERGAAGRPERAVRLREVGSLTAGGGQAITKISQLVNDKGYVTGADAAGIAEVAVTAHEAKTDPHPQYTTEAEAAAAAPIQSIQAGDNVTIDATDPRNPVINASGGTPVELVYNRIDADGDIRVDVDGNLRISG